ncbi:YhbY family RNA-binding protein [Candidatus Bathyarchaeota archaeon]|nr:YhbY family RNA-binding protein [Candidatus Bathyarchaeota archaeon]
MRARSTSRSQQPLKPTIRIGKKGVTHEQILEILKQLEARGTVKIKVLKSALTNDTMENIAKRISAETGSKIIQMIGHTFMLFKPKRKRGQKLQRR